MPTDEVKKILNISDNNIFINWPEQMGVEGINLESDIRSFLDAIILKDYIKIDEDKYCVCDDKHVFTKKK